MTIYAEELEFTLPLDEIEELTEEELESIEGGVAPLIIYSARIISGAVVGGVIAGAKTYIEDGAVNWRSVAVGVGAGAVSGAVGGWLKVKGW
ncbi:class IIb bacteriocin, lactobin A/cerein 7B family [Deinococcus fonticola]|uniref:class IIb bacteriocin, lactobin A/cerein 7B family n=1 Tax=Deinococcus fonticola TaxID=2528713 RepID=UPI0010758908|nr:class IIb bacteriocin, lactobin A/cerein 7B family [Deinococcus fonticola]